MTALTRTIITIQCYASGVPTPTVTWTKDDLRIPSGGRYTVEEDGSLMIADSKEGDSAKYRCTATSVAGKDSASSIVQIVGKLLTHKHKHFIVRPRPPKSKKPVSSSPLIYNRLRVQYHNKVVEKARVFEISCLFPQSP